jgi:hypothetical protein
MSGLLPHDTEAASWRVRRFVICRQDSRNTAVKARTQIKADQVANSFGDPIITTSRRLEIRITECKQPDTYFSEHIFRHHGGLL